VNYLGRLRDPEKRAMLASASVFVAPNLRGESFGIILAEAMAAGCAVIASDLPAFRAVAQNAASYVAPGDPDVWAEAIISMLGAPEWISSLRAVGSRAVKQFDWSVVTDQYRDIYRRTLDG
jgi:phosphatidylinositol alpha-mannosyltransferase